MATPAYSTRLLAELGLVGSASFGPAPGFIYVVRDIDAYNGGGLVVTQLFFEGHLGQTLTRFDSSQDGGPSAHQWQGRQIIEAGELYTIHTTGAWDVTISGYALIAP